MKFSISILFIGFCTKCVLSASIIDVNSRDTLLEQLNQTSKRMRDAEKNWKLEAKKIMEPVGSNMTLTFNLLQEKLESELVTHYKDLVAESELTAKQNQINLKWCRPGISIADEPARVIKSAVHPCTPNLFESEKFIPVTELGIKFNGHVRALIDELNELRKRAEACQADSQLCFHQLRLRVQEIHQKELPELESQGDGYLRRLKNVVEEIPNHDCNIDELADSVREKYRNAAERLAHRVKECIADEMTANSINS